MPLDIRELAGRPEAYAAELRRRWGGLLSYRYIGRTYAQMDLGPTDNTVTLRRDMRNATGGLLLAVLGIASPEGGHMSDLEAVPNPVIHSCQILDAGRDVRRIEIVSEELKRGRQMGYSRSKIVDADQPDRVLALTRRSGHQYRHAAGRASEDGGRAHRGDGLPRPAAAVAGVRRAIVAPTGVGRCQNWRTRWRPPTPLCTSGRSSSSWRRLRSTPRPRSWEALRFKGFRRT